MDYLLHILILIGIYTILVASLNLAWGYAGLLSFTHAAFAGIGAYGTALLLMRLGVNFFPALLAACLLAGLLGALLAGATARLGGDYFILAVLGFQIVATAVFLNWVDVTRGPFGLYGIPKPMLFGHPLLATWQYLALVVACTGLVVALIHRIVTLPFGRTLRAIREDEVAVRVLGKDVAGAKVIVFAVSAGCAALAGGLYAHYYTYVDPFIFDIHESILLATMVVVGGASLRGSLVGALVLLLFPEALRALNVPGEVTAYLRQILYGALLFLFMLVRPQGLIAERAS
ncbi:MAG: branched-chain amino acid ABC transporter permease [Deltaproteobacteria bacterium]|nr:branched-chain amino acid ABC transporter permease [Deltaproteobacteria bacterium]